MLSSNEQRTRRIQLLLFIITAIATTVSGAEWMTGKLLLYGEHKVNWQDFWHGLYFSIPFLTVLTVHEFGHYFTARYHSIKVTLPFYIPLWLGFIAGPSIGTMGALIRIKEQIIDRKKYFDVGISGPLAGFVVALGVLAYGFSSLPPKSYVFDIHPDYEQYGDSFEEHVYSYEYMDGFMRQMYSEQREKDSIAYVIEQGTAEGWTFPQYVSEPYYETLAIGRAPLFDWMESVFADPDRIPNAYELMHYPWLFAGFLSLFFTSLNLLPVGQLDGGHILYGLVGAKWHRHVARAVFMAFIYYAGLGLFDPKDIMSEFFTVALYVGFLYLSFYKFSMLKRDRWMYALIIFTAQFITLLFYPGVEGYAGWLLFAFILGRFLGIYHPPVIIDHPLDWRRKVLGWMALVVFIVSLSPKPFEHVRFYSNNVMSDTPSILSLTNPSPYVDRIDMPSSRPLASRNSMKLEEEMSVLAD